MPVNPAAVVHRRGHRRVRPDGQVARPRSGPGNPGHRAIPRPGRRAAVSGARAPPVPRRHRAPAGSGGRRPACMAPEAVILDGLIRTRVPSPGSGAPPWARRQVPGHAHRTVARRQPADAGARARRPRLRRDRGFHRRTHPPGAGALGERRGRGADRALSGRRGELGSVPGTTRVEADHRGVPRAG